MQNEHPNKYNIPHSTYEEVHHLPVDGNTLYQQPYVYPNSQPYSYYPQQYTQYIPQPGYTTTPYPGYTDQRLIYPGYENYPTYPTTNQPMQYQYPSHQYYDNRNTAYYQPQQPQQTVNPIQLLTRELINYNKKSN